MTQNTEQQNDRARALVPFAEQLANAAAAVTLGYFRRQPGVENKEQEGFDPVTRADREAEAAIRTLIEAHYPEHGIDGEEFPEKPAAGPWSWSLDPVDGTRAFIAGLPCWGTLIALLYDGRPLVGIIDQPFLKERYIGFPGGATLNAVPIERRACPHLGKATLMTTDPELFRDAERAAFERLKTAVRLTRYGFDCYAYAMLAAGHIDMVIESGLDTHDRMALIPVVQGAGGSATDWQGTQAGPSDQLLAVGDPALVAPALDILRGA